MTELKDSEPKHLIGGECTAFHFLIVIGPSCEFVDFYVEAERLEDATKKIRDHLKKECLEVGYSLLSAGRLGRAILLKKEEGGTK